MEPRKFHIESRQREAHRRENHQKRFNVYHARFPAPPATRQEERTAGRNQNGTPPPTSPPVLRRVVFFKRFMPRYGLTPFYRGPAVN